MAPRDMGNRVDGGKNRWAAKEDKEERGLHLDFVRENGLFKA